MDRVGECACSGPFYEMGAGRNRRWVEKKNGACRAPANSVLTLTNDLLSRFGAGRRGRECVGCRTMVKLVKKEKRKKKKNILVGLLHVILPNSPTRLLLSHRRCASCFSQGDWLRSLLPGSVLGCRAAVITKMPACFGHSLKLYCERNGGCAVSVQAGYLLPHAIELKYCMAAAR